jgi:hypothetical protein
MRCARQVTISATLDRTAVSRSFVGRLFCAMPTLLADRVRIGPIASEPAKGRNRLINSSWAMRLDLEYVLETLRDHQTELRRLGVAHAAVFGSVARGEERAESDIDVLVDLDENRPMGIFEYARLKLYINELLDGSSDVVNRRTLKPLLQASILRDIVHAF